MNTTPQEGGNRPLSSGAPTLPSQPAQPLTAPWLWAALASYPLAYLYTKEILLTGRFADWGMPVFAVLFVLGVDALARALHRAPAGETPLWAACYLALSVVMPLWGRQGGGLGSWQALAWHLFAIWYVLSRCNMLAAGHTGSLFFLDGLAGCFTLPWPAFLCRLRAVRQLLRGLRPRSGRANRRLPAVLGSGALALLLCAFAWQQLAAADRNFAAVAAALGRLVDLDFLFQNGRLLSWLVYFLLSLPVGAWLYGLVAGSLRRETPPCPAALFWQKLAPCQRLPVFTVRLVLAALCAVYALFFGVQAAAFLTAGRGPLSAPDAAAFAVDGFWELCRILLLNFTVLAAARFFAAGPLPRRLAALFAAFGVAFALLDGAKLLAYIRLYGFTPRRVVAGWFLCVLLVWAVLVLLRLFRVIPTARLAIAVLAVSFTLLGCVNMNRRIIRANIDRYAAGVDAQLDLAVLQQCGMTFWGDGMFAVGQTPVTEYTQWLLDAGWFEGRSVDDLQELYLFDYNAVTSADGSAVTCRVRLDDANELLLDMQGRYCTAARIRTAAS